MYSGKKIGIVVICLLAVSAAAVGFFRASGSVKNVARLIVASCARSGIDHSACYEAEVPALYPKMSVAQIFEVVREIRALDVSYQFCHVLGHKIGERVVAEDPAQWVDMLSLTPPEGVCSNGYVHGVTVGRFRSEVLDDATIEKFIPQFSLACSNSAKWSPSDLDREGCYHGLGHLFDFITNTDIPKALSICSRAVPSDFRHFCFDGVFMQIFRPREPEDFLMIQQLPVQPTKATVGQFCRSFEDSQYVGACIRESWPFFRDEILSGSGVEALCAAEPDVTERKYCYGIEFSTIGRAYVAEPGKAVSACLHVPEDQQSSCVVTVAQILLEEDRTNAMGAMAFCQSIPTESLAAECLSGIVNRSVYIFGTDEREFGAFCRPLPGVLKDRCDALQRSAAK
ncbi:hypothetical protein K8R03_02795 [Candidatus Kaiserbacteria bacterium]|nr:hypothetical protein [Candidatus Kaiserbacteria bacterium]